MEKFVGQFISLKCTDGRVYQGQIVDVSSSNIQIEKAFCDGRPSPVQPVTILSQNVKSLELLNLDKPKEIELNGGSPKPIDRRVGAKSAESTFKVERPVPLRIKVDPQSARKKKQRQRWVDRNEEAFGSPVDNTQLPDFDFEKNLALFDKKAIFDAMNASKPDLVRQTDRRAVPTYRPDENVIPCDVPFLKQMKVPDEEAGNVVYVTDTGLMVPSISLGLRSRIISLAEDAGLSFAKRAELVGRAVTEMAIHLLGGAHRLNRQNLHQTPLVAVLIGGHRGAVQVCASARQLTSHGVRVIVFLNAPSHSVNKEVLNELKLLQLSGASLTTSIQDLNNSAVDLIIVGLSDSEGGRGNSSAVSRWAQNHRASILAVDPPPEGVIGLTAKCCVVPFLPLAHDPSNGRVYLCNVGVPAAVFQHAGLRYFPPFGPKFVIPLHTN